MGYVRGVAPVGNGSRKRVSNPAASDDSRPPSNAAVTFLRETDGKLNVSWLSSIMAGVAAKRETRRMASIGRLRWGLRVFF